MNSISNDYAVRAPPVTIVPSPAGSTVLNLQPDPSLRTVGRSTASRTPAPGRATDAQQQNSATFVATTFADPATPENSPHSANLPSSRPRSSVDLYRTTQSNVDSADSYAHIDLYA